MSRFLTLCVASLLGGCGTMANMDGRSHVLLSHEREPRAFGGVINDIRWARDQSERAIESSTVMAIPFNIVLAGYFGFVDLPLSLIGDIVTLPKVMGWTSERYPPPTKISDKLPPPTIETASNESGSSSSPPNQNK